jgi:hypothetical protein
MNKTIRTAVTLGMAAAPLVASVALGAAPANAATADPPAGNASLVAVHPNVYAWGDCGELFMFNSTDVRIRASWGTSAAVRGYGQRGQWFAGNYKTSYEYNGYFWVEGTDDNTGVTGYVALPLLTDEGPVGCTYLS